jgi:hypothetical protein
VRAETTGSAPAIQGGGALGVPARSTADQFAEHGQAAGTRERSANGQREEDCPNKPGLAGRLLGFVGLLVAALLLRGQTPERSDERATT